MSPNQARVFIIEDDPDKLGHLTQFVEASGGRVVGSVNTRKDGHDAIGAADFPASVNDANTVLVDGNLDRHGRHGTDGLYIFQNGYERGVLHRVDSAEGIGAVAIGCSIDDRSDVAHATGGNIGYKRTAAQWAALLAPHPAEPLYLGEGVIERKDWSGDWQFDEMLEYVIDPQDTPVVTVLSLAVVEAKKQGGEEAVTYTDEVVSPIEMLYEEFAEKAGTWRGAENGRITVDSHTARAVVRAGSYLYVISHTSRLVKNIFGRSDPHANGKTDKIAISGLSQLPDAYWANLGLKRPVL